MPIPVERRTLTELDLALIDTDQAHTDHLDDFGAHSRNTFLRAHVDNVKRHLPAPPPSGTFTLKAVDGNLKWVAG